jgi:hypothetical protein
MEDGGEIGNVNKTRRKEHIPAMGGQSRECGGNDDVVMVEPRSAMEGRRRGKEGGEDGRRMEDGEGARSTTKLAAATAAR